MLSSFAKSTWKSICTSTRYSALTKYSHYDPDSRTNEVKHVIELLTKARVCFPVVSSHCNGIPLNAEADEKSFKLLFLDVGLATHILGLNWNSVQQLS